MARSQNGYPANDRSVLAAFYVGDRKFMFRAGPAGSLLHHAITWFDQNIRDINPGIMDDWSYAERPIRGGVELSNHASGTAGDVDATKWPMGRPPEVYLSGDEIARLRAHLALYEGCIRWGGDYTGRKDPMHFEVNRDEATCARVWAKISGGVPSPVPAPAPAPAPAPSGRPTIKQGASGQAVRDLQARLRASYPAYRRESPVRRGVLLTVDGAFGPWTDAWVRIFQRRSSGLVVDGIVGPKTWRALGLG